MLEYESVMLQDKVPLKSSWPAQQGACMTCQEGAAGEGGGGAGGGGAGEGKRALDA